MLDAWVSLRLSFALLRGGGGSKDAARRVDEYGFPTFSATCVDASPRIRKGEGWESLREHRSQLVVSGGIFTIFYLPWIC